jgi:asparagine synthetase B (glutamine-hydrolysing)
MEIFRQLKFYEFFKEAVKKRTVERMAVPVSGGLDSTLIVKALRDNGDLDKCTFICFEENKYIKVVAATYGIDVIYLDLPEPTESERQNVIYILEEPFYSHSVNYYLYKKINELEIRVSLSGLGADELFGGYDYYNSERYPRGLFEPIVAKTNQEKKLHDLDFLVHHHLRENEKIGLFWSVEGRYPFLDKYVCRYTDVGKSLIKQTLLKDFSRAFVYRKKTGFRIDNNKNRDHQRKEYLRQFEIWKTIFT